MLFPIPPGRRAKRPLASLLSFLIVLASLPAASSAAAASSPAAAQQGSGGTHTWDFSNPAEYVFDNANVEVTSGQARLKLRWLNSAWKFRRAVTVDNSAGADVLTGYQLPITVPFESGMRSDFGDVRFTGDDGWTPVPYWVEKRTQTSATFWVKVPAVAAASSATVYVYFGNPAATSASSGTDTFDFFDDFVANASPASPLFYGVQPSVIKEGSAYWMFYDDGLGNIFRRTSADGVSYGSPVHIMSNARYCDVAKVGTGYRLVYVSYDQLQVKVATSADGVFFKEQGTAVTVGNNGEWDSWLVADPTEIKVGSVYYLFYGGANQTTNEFAIGLATSLTGLPGSYTKRGVVMSRSLPGFTPSLNVFDADVFEYDAGKYMMFYTEFDGKRHVTTYATSTNLTDWVKSGGQLYIATQPYELAATYGPNEPSVLIENGQYRVWHRGNPDSTSQPNVGYFTIPQDPRTKLPNITVQWSVTNLARFRVEDGIAKITATNKSYIYSNNFSFADGLVEAKVKFTRNNNFNLSARINPTLSRGQGVGGGGLKDNLLLFGHTASGFVTYAKAPFASGTDYNIYKLGLTGNSVRAAAWKPDAAEPTGWLLEGEGSPLPAGAVGFYSNNSDAWVDWIRVRKHAAVEPRASLAADREPWPSPVGTAASIRPAAPQGGFTNVTGFAESATKNGGEIKYQLSNDGGQTWYWWNGSGWSQTAAGFEQANAASEVNARIRSFPVQNGPFLFNAYLISDGSQAVRLDSVTVTYSNDTLPPVISDVRTFVAINDGSALIQWTTDEPSSTQVEIGQTTSYGKVSALLDVASPVTNHSVPLSTLAACTTYHFRAISIDPVGNRALSPDGIFTTNGCTGEATPTPTPTPTPAPSIAGQLTDPTGAPVADAVLTLSGAQSGTTQTDANGNYSFGNLAAGDYTLVASKGNFAFNPPSRSFANLSDSQAANFKAVPLTYGIGGRVTDSAQNGVANVPVVLSGVVTRVTQTDAGGSYQFANVVAGGSYSVTAGGENLSVTPSRADFTNVSADGIANFTVVQQIDVAPAPNTGDPFGSAQRDPQRFNFGLLTQPAGAFDPQVAVVQSNAQITITPRAGVDGLHFNGYVTVNLSNLTGGTVGVEVVRAAAGGARTLFSLGSDEDNFFRFVVEGQTLLFQSCVDGVLVSKSVPYDVAQHRFWRFRHDVATNAILFETSADNTEWTLREEAAQPGGVSALAVELSAGTVGRVADPGHATFSKLSWQAAQ